MSDSRFPNANIDPETGLAVDPDTGLPIDPNDPRPRLSDGKLDGAEMRRRWEAEATYRQTLASKANWK